MLVDRAVGTLTPRAARRFEYDDDGNPVETFIAGDMNCDGLVDGFATEPFILAMQGQQAYEQQYPDCEWLNGDINGDGTVNGFDLDGFIAMSENGNGAVSLVYAWDAENRLTSVGPPAGTEQTDDWAVEFKYDHQGRRIEKIYSTYDGSNWDEQSHTKFVWDGWLLLMELDGNNSDAALRKYTWGLDLAGQSGASASGRSALDGAGGIGGLLAVQDTNGTPGDEQDDLKYTYFYDANGNIGQLFDWGTGTIVAKYEYDPYGNNLLDPADVQESGFYAATNAIRFSTRPFDTETGLGSWPARYYSPRFGRWLNRDPIEEAGGLNLYNSFGNRPVDTIDSLGFQTYKPPPMHRKLCGIFIVCPRKDIVVKPEKYRDTLLKAGLDPDALIGFEVIFLPTIPSTLGEYKGPSPNPMDCCCGCENSRNIRLVQVIRWGGALGRRAPEVDGAKPGQTTPPGMTPPGRTGDGTSFEDGPYNPAKAGGQGTAELEICAFCTVKGTETNLGCFRMTWTHGTSANKWKDRTFRIETQGTIPSTLTEGEYKGCQMIGPDPPGRLFGTGLDGFPPVRRW